MLSNLCQQISQFIILNQDIKEAWLNKNLEARKRLSSA
jgi:hypothetical protein